jgi:hypothetical protein
VQFEHLGAEPQAEPKTGAYLRVDVDLAPNSTGKVVYTLKTPYRDGTTQVAFAPVDFIARSAALARARSDLNRGRTSLAITAF